MKIAKTSAVAALLLTLPMLMSVTPSVAATGGEKLNVKPGLWEITSTMRYRGVPPLPKEVLEKMTPEQQAKMQQDWQAEREPDVSTECITQADLDKPFQSGNDDDCTQTIVRTTRTTQEIRMVCSGEIKGSGVFRVTTPTPDTMTGELDLQAGEGAAAFTIKGTIKGRWLGPDCGDEHDAGDDIYEEDEDDVGDIYEEDEDTAEQ